MHAEITIDETGRITLPQALREELHLVPGDTVTIDTADEAITLRPGRETIYKQEIPILYVRADLSQNILKTPSSK